MGAEETRAPRSEKVAIKKPGSRPSPDTGSADTLILDLPASRTVKHQGLLLQPPSLWYLLGQPKLITHHPHCQSGPHLEPQF
uniref:Uncharacterized protein n=1 Tax=Mustela putorius furo TaxID=9669 RepID=M3YTR7_MUSPF